MKRILLLTISVSLLLVATSAFATKTRLLTLGEQFTIVRDDAEIFRYAGRIAEYPGLATGEYRRIEFKEIANQPLSSSSGDENELEEVGVHWNLGTEQNPRVLGTYLMGDGFQNEVLRTKFTSISVPYSAFSAVLPNKRIMLAYGQPLSGTFNSIGVSAEWLHSSQTVLEGGETDYKNGASMYTFNAGVTMQDGRADLAGMIRFGSFTYQNRFGSNLVEQYEPNGNFYGSVRYRRFLDVNDRMELVPHASFACGLAGYNSYDNVGGPLQSVRVAIPIRLAAGLGLVWRENEQVRVFGDWSASYLHGREQVKNASGSLTFDRTGDELSLFRGKLGGEFDLFPQLTLRAGSTFNWMWANITDRAPNPNNKQNRSFTDNQTFLGLGLHFGKVTMDLHVNPELALNGPAAITDDNTNDPIWQASALVDFF